MRGQVHRLDIAPEAAHRLVRRRLLDESVEMIENALGQLAELQDRLDGAGDHARLDFTRLSAIRAQAADLASATGKLGRRPFRTHSTATTREGDHRCRS